MQVHDRVKRTRETAVYSLKIFLKSAKCIAGYISERESGFHGCLPWISNQCAQDVLGEGFPLEYTIGSPRGIGEIVLCNRFSVTIGYTLVDEMAKYGATMEQKVAAMDVVEAYRDFLTLIHSKSHALCELLTPLQGSEQFTVEEWRRALTEEEKKLARQGGFEVDTLSQYHHYLEEGFGIPFRNFVLFSISIEEFDRYVDQLSKGLELFISTIPAEK